MNSDKNNEVEIIDATPDDAHMIAAAILDAVGDEIVMNLAGNGTREDVLQLFARLARRTDTQYSYLNTRIALVEGQKAGVCISYDGGRLFELRRTFFDEARRTFGWEITDEEVDALPGETGSDEYYLDTLATLPDFRRRGVASALIADALQQARACELPLGLLVADGNVNAQKLYASCGFKPAGRRLFAGEEMTDMQLH